MLTVLISAILLRTSYHQVKRIQTKSLVLSTQIRLFWMLSLCWIAWEQTQQRAIFWLQLGVKEVDTKS